MKGVPFRIEIGPKDVEKQQVVIVRRHDNEKMFIKESELEQKITELANNYTKELKEKKLLDFEEQIEVCYEPDSVKEALDKGKIACCGFCSIDKAGMDCAAKVEKDLGGFVRGKKVSDEKHDFASCAICGEPASCLLF